MNRVREREVHAFAAKLSRLIVGDPVVAVLVGHIVDPEAEPVGRQLGIMVLSTLGLRR